MNFIGLITAIAIKTEYHFGVKAWWVFLLLGLAFIVSSLFVNSQIVSTIAGVVGCSFLWSILELFQQRKRVERGWFPKNPKRKD